ncbi:stage V sporulation protein D [bacterium BMS3Abin15]|nr:stage V sporulation protein D [bacterium BMS3Abin15]HDZ85294.1 penicillin-binding protein 2 [Candidatus Moranbacteria bacterium]
MDRYINKQDDSRGMEIEDSILSTTGPEAARIESPLDKKWMNFFWWIIIISLIVLSGRVFYLNVIKGDYYQKVAEGNRIRTIVIKAPRGRIYDRFGNTLVNNIPSIDAVVVPADLPNESSERKKVAEQVAKILGLNGGDTWGMIENLNGKSLNPGLLKENISHEESLVILEKRRELPGIEIEKTAVRDYVDSTIFSHILGFEGKIKKEELETHPDYLLTDYIGKQGLEKSYEEYLRGIHGGRQVEVDSLGDVKKEIGTVAPQPGGDLFLSIDAELQKTIFDKLSNILERTQTRTAAAIAINPQNGEVLALVSLPSFDNNLFSQGMSQEDYSQLINDPDKPLFNRAISGEYPPGSTIKPLIAAAALEENIINENTTVVDSGAINVGSYVFRDWKTHGVTDIRKAIAESCDVFFYSVGGGFYGIEGLGMSRMKKYENLFGWGEKLGIDIPGETDGFVPDEQWKLEALGEKWYIGNSYHAAIGQGFITATPLQVVNYITAIANDGTLYQPRIVSYINKIDGEKMSNDPEIIRENLVSEKNIKIIQEGMRQAVVSGTATMLNSLPVEVAGKTGTAQFGVEGRTHSWFVSYAPYENPKIAIVVLVEGGREDSFGAVPVTKDIYEWYFTRVQNQE